MGCEKWDDSRGWVTILRVFLMSIGQISCGLARQGLRVFVREAML